MSKRRRYGTRGKISEALQVATLLQGQVSYLGGASHNEVTLDETVSEVLSIGAGTAQQLATNTAVLAGDLINAESTSGTVVLQYLNIGTAGFYLRSNGSTPVWTAPEVGDFSDLDYDTPALTFSTANAEGSADTVIRTDATLALFDATNPADVDLSAAAGSAGVAARRDHGHAIDVTIAPTWSGLHTFANDVTLDDGSGDSPSLDFVGGSNNDTVSLFLSDNGTAADSDFIIKLAATDSDSRVSILDSADSEVAWIDADGNAGWDGVGYFSDDLVIGNTTFASGITGGREVEIYGSNPLVTILGTGDNHALFQIECAGGHDSVSIAFDAYWDRSNWVSSDAGSNFRIVKASDTLKIDYDQIAAGSNITWNTMMAFVNNGRVGIGDDSPEVPLHIASGSAGSDPAWAGTDVILIESSDDAIVQFFSPTNRTGTFSFSDTTRNRGYVQYDHGKVYTDSMLFGTAGNTQIRIDSTGNVTLRADFAQDLATAGVAWDEAYADNWNNVADFFYLDDKDDLGVLLNIRQSDKLDRKTGLPLIDDDSLPDWMLTKDKHTGEIARNSLGKPYLSMRMITSLLMGAIRQLTNEVRNGV